MKPSMKLSFYLLVCYCYMIASVEKTLL